MKHLSVVLAVLLLAVSAMAQTFVATTNKAEVETGGDIYTIGTEIQEC